MDTDSNNDFDDGAFRERLKAVQDRIDGACARAGRAPASVCLLPVTKGFGPEAVSAVAAAGIDVVAENRVQEAVWKAESCRGLQWHMIGHLQRNKARLALAHFSWLHAVDSLRLVDTLDRLAEAEGGAPKIMLEINVSGEASKFGLPPEKAPAVIERALESRSLALEGLMTMAPFSPDPERSRPVFSRLREWRDRWAETFGVPLTELSMGMSGDFEVAIECGATFVRLGSVLFGPRLSWTALQARMRQDAGLAD